MISQPPSSLQPQPKLTSGLAITSLVCGIVSFVILIIPALVAIICGHVARARIKKSNGALEGKGKALAGLICGYTSIALVTGGTSWIVYEIKENKRVKQEEIATEISRGKEIYALVMLYEADHGKFPDTLSELVEKGYASSIDHLQPTQGGNWVYFQGLTSTSSSYKYLIRSDHHMVVIHTDGSSGSRDLHYTMEPTDDPMRSHESVRE